jgi:hypothetical protein
MSTVTRDTTGDLPAFVRRHGIALLLAAASLAFFLPFGTVACDGEVVHFTGVELATRHVPPDPDSRSAPGERLDDEVESDAGTYALMALVFAVVGIGAVAWRGLGGGFAVASLLSLVLLLLDSGVSMADVRIEIGYWLALGLVLTAVVMRARSRWRARRSRRRAGVTAPRPPLREWLRRHAPTWALGASAVAIVVVLEAATTQGS